MAGFPDRMNDRVGDVSERSGTTMDSVRDAAASAADSAREQAGRIREKAANAYHQARDVASEQLGRAGERAREAYEHSRDTVSAWGDDVRDYIQQEPMKALLVAAGVGLLLGALWRRRD